MRNRCTVGHILNSPRMLATLLVTEERARADVGRRKGSELFGEMYRGRKCSMAQNFKAKLEQSGPLPGSLTFYLQGHEEGEGGRRQH